MMMMMMMMMMMEDKGGDVNGEWGIGNTLES